VHYQVRAEVRPRHGEDLHDSQDRQGQPGGRLYEDAEWNAYSPDPSRSASKESNEDFYCRPNQEKELKLEAEWAERENEAMARVLHDDVARVQRRCSHKRCSHERILSTVSSTTVSSGDIFRMSEEAIHIVLKVDDIPHFLQVQPSDKVFDAVKSNLGIDLAAMDDRIKRAIFQGSQQVHGSRSFATQGVLDGATLHTQMKIKSREDLPPPSKLSFDTNYE